MSEFGSDIRYYGIWVGLFMLEYFLACSSGYFSVSGFSCVIYIQLHIRDKNWKMLLLNVKSNETTE